MGALLALALRCESPGVQGQGLGVEVGDASVRPRVGQRASPASTWSHRQVLGIPGPTWARRKENLCQGGGEL